jgi:hypothetical protein
MFSVRCVLSGARIPIHCRHCCTRFGLSVTVWTHPQPMAALTLCTPCDCYLVSLRWCLLCTIVRHTHLLRIHHIWVCAALRAGSNCCSWIGVVASWMPAASTIVGADPFAAEHQYVTQLAQAGKNAQYGRGWRSAAGTAHHGGTARGLRLGVG